MLARPFRPRVFTLAASLALAACASAGPPQASEYVSPTRMLPLTASSRSFDAAAIRRSGAITAWDAIRSLVPPHRLYATRDASLRDLTSARARSSDAGVQFVLDGQPILDPEPLRSIPAAEVVSLRILSASEAASYFAGGGASGAILVETRFALRRR